jgi:hypothetical protein
MSINAHILDNITANTVTLLHTLQSNLPFEWLEGMHSVITQQRPFVSVVHLRLAYRIMGPLLPRLLISRPLFAKVLALPDSLTFFVTTSIIFSYNFPYILFCYRIFQRGGWLYVF